MTYSLMNAHAQFMAKVKFTTGNYYSKLNVLAACDNNKRNQYDYTKCV